MMCALFKVKLTVYVDSVRMLHVLYPSNISMEFIVFSDIRLRKEHTSRVLGHFLQYDGSYRSMENMANVVNSTPDASIKVASSKYRIKKLISPAIKTEIHIECLNCRNYIPSDISTVNCDMCDRIASTSQSDYFIYLPIEK